MFSASPIPPRCRLVNESTAPGRLPRIAFAIGFITLLNVPLFAQDWPHWRGPNRNDCSDETDLLQEWPEGGPKRVWINDNSGLGYAGFSVVDNRLYTMGLFEQREYALCLNALTGEEIWRAELSDTFSEQHGDGPRSTPSVDGDRVYFMTATGTLACLDKNEGKPQWSIQMQDFGGSIPQWGYAESPLIDGDRVVCTPGGPKGTVLAVDKLTGEKIWQSVAVTKDFDGEQSPPVKAHYSSLIPITWNGKRQYVQLTVLGIIGVDSENGSLLWQSDWPGRIAVIPSPIFDNGQIYVSSGYGTGSKLIELDAQNQPTDLWFTKAICNHHGSVILRGDYFYGSSEKAFVCQDRKTGEAIWGLRKIRKGAIVFADGLFYHVQEDDGKVLLFSANETEVKIKGEFKLDPQSDHRKSGRVWVHPVIANGKLYLRDQEYIYCYDVKK